MQKIVYRHIESGQSWDWVLPKIFRWNGISNMRITEANMARFGITKEVIELPDPEPTTPILSEALITKEKIFVKKLVEIAIRFQIDLAALSDINIQALLNAAQQNGVSDNDIANASSILLALAKDIEAESGMTWTNTWLGLKSRLPSYLAALL